MKEIAMNDFTRLKNKLIIVITVNLFISLSQIIGGIISGSLALISDSVHNLGDTFSIFISLIAIVVARKSSNQRYTYGYKRAEIIASTFNSAILIFIALLLGKEAISRINKTEAVRGSIMFVFGLLGVVVNFVSAMIIHYESKRKLVIKSTYLHLLTDSLTSVSVIVGSFFIILFGAYFVDSVITLLVCVFILKESVKLLLESVEILMQKAPASISIPQMIKELENIEGIKDVHHVHLWRLNDDSVFFECHVTLDSNIVVEELDKIRKKIEALLTGKFGISHTTIQFESRCSENKTN